MAHIQHINCSLSNREQNTIDVFGFAMKELADFFRKNLVFNRQGTATGLILKGRDRNSSNCETSGQQIQCSVLDTTDRLVQSGLQQSG